MEKNQKDAGRNKNDNRQNQKSTLGKSKEKDEKDWKTTGNKKNTGASEKGNARNERENM